MALIICLWSSKYFKMINIQQYSFRFVTSFINGKKNAKNNCFLIWFAIQAWICDLQDPCCSPHTFSGYSYFSSITFKISQYTIEILLLGVKSDVRSALNRLNTNWPQTRQDFVMDNYSLNEENNHQVPCPTQEIPVSKIDFKV